LFTSNLGVDELLDILGRLPLALVQAGAYLHETGTTVADYIGHYNNTWIDLMHSQSQSLLEENGGQSVLTTWKMSYEQIKRTDPLAAKLLDLWAFLHRDDLWQELVLVGRGSEQQTSPAYDDEALPGATGLRLTNSIGTLARFSMINRGGTNGSHSIHPVVHTWCLHNITDPAAKRKMLAIAARFVAKMARSLSGDATRDLKLRLAAQAKTVGSRVAPRLDYSEIADDCHEIALFLIKWEKTDEVENLFLQALQGREKTLGPDHESTLDTIHNLGKLYAGQGKMMAAEEMCQWALRGREKTLGPEHTSTLATVNNLGLLYAEQGRIAAAEEMYLRALRGYENTPGPERTSALMLLNNLGILYRNQAKVTAAKEMFQRALRGKEEAWGPKHTSTLYTVINLGNLYADQGKMADAEEMYQRALQGYEESLGPTHSSTLDTLDNLGDLYRKQGKMRAAGEVYIRALAGYENMSPTPKVEARVAQIKASLASAQANVSTPVPKSLEDNGAWMTPALSERTSLEADAISAPSTSRRGLRQIVLALRKRTWS
jgi:tetratricopeptide (TPR) repeat protein